MAHQEDPRLSDRQALVKALLLGEAACLSMMLFHPISDTQKKWEKAAEFIGQERKRLEQCD